jgi:hypothetical protein
MASIPSKDWIELVDERVGDIDYNLEYVAGVRKFIEYAFQQTGAKDQILCPCIKCDNAILGTCRSVEMHLKVYGIIKEYTFWHHHGEQEIIEPQPSRGKKRVRGKNRLREIEALKPGEKLFVTFYHNRAVGENHTVFTRYLGKLIRDRNICPFRVHSWNKIEDREKDIMWAAVTEKFMSDDIELYRQHTLDHMKELWAKWRARLHTDYVKTCETLEEAATNVPPGVNEIDWEWLVLEHFSCEKFKKASERNTLNRSKQKSELTPRTGSKPFREISYHKGGKEGNPPNMVTMFYETRRKENGLDPVVSEKYYEMKETVETEPLLSEMEVTAKCFGPQKRSYMFGYGGGMRPKDVRGNLSSKADLERKLREQRKENDEIKNRLTSLENELAILKGILLGKQFLDEPAPSLDAAAPLAETHPDSDEEQTESSSY